MSILWYLLAGAGCGVLMDVAFRKLDIGKPGKDVKVIDYSSMKQNLTKLLQKDGYKYEMNEGILVMHYKQERFNIHISESILGGQYARVTVVDEYTVEGIGEVHPFAMDALMGRASYRCSRIGNISFEDHCDCFIGTDVRNIKDFYLGLRRTLDLLIDNENYVRQEFVRYKEEFGRKKDVEERNGHIGFRTSAEEVREKESKVAAETNVTTTN